MPYECKCMCRRPSKTLNHSQPPIILDVATKKTPQQVPYTLSHLDRSHADEIGLSVNNTLNSNPFHASISHMPIWNVGDKQPQMPKHRLCC
jgi:hypothetical protein